MPLNALNLRKFTACLNKYRQDVRRTLWIKNELPKFYFSNHVNRLLKLRVQSNEMIFQVCERIQDQNYYWNTTESRISGIQFLKKTGSPQFSQPVTRADVEIFKRMADGDSWAEDDFKGMTISYSAMSGWLGTLLPIKFVPVTSTLFRHTISYLFDLELKIYQHDDFEYFRNSQHFFYLTKRKLREVNLESLYLDEIAEYVRVKHPKSSPKKKYDEADLNWLTQDFHLYVFREVLGLDTPGIGSIFDQVRRAKRQEILKCGLPGLAKISVP